MSTNKRIFIPDHEYQERIQNAAKLITQMQDIFLASGHFLNVPGLPSLHPEMLPLW